MCHVSRVTCHVSCVTCHVSCVTCHVSHVTCHLSHFKIFFLKSFIVTIIFTKEFKPVEALFLWQLLGDFVKVLSLVIAYQFLAKKMSPEIAEKAAEIVLNFESNKKEEIALRKPQEILEEMRALDAESSDILNSILELI